MLIIRDSHLCACVEIVQSELADSFLSPVWRGKQQEPTRSTGSPGEQSTAIMWAPGCYYNPRTPDDWDEVRSYRRGSSVACWDLSSWTNEAMDPVLWGSS